MYSRAAPAWCLVGRGSANCSLAMEDEATKRAHGTARHGRKETRRVSPARVPGCDRPACDSTMARHEE
jgi:hypothetical protein